MGAVDCAILLTSVQCSLLFFGRVSWTLVVVLLAIGVRANPLESPTLVSSGKIAGSWYQSTRSPQEDRHHEDDDSDEDDDDDDNERTNSVVVAAIPVVLGVLAIVLLCVFMMCRRNSQNRQQAKWGVRQQRASLTTTHLDDPERLDQPPYETVNYVTTRPALQEMVTPSAPPDVASDLPPSYEDVMRDARRTNQIT